MVRTFTVLLAFMVSATTAAGYNFDFDSYKPTPLEEILRAKRPKTGVDVGMPRKFRCTVTLESYAKPNCGPGGLILFTMSMLPDVYSPQIKRAMSERKCIRVKSEDGNYVVLAIQDKVAEFLPEEIPLGSPVNLYCVLVCVAADGPCIVVTEFQQVKKSEGRPRANG